MINQNRDMDRVRRELFLRAEPEYGELYQSFQMHVEAAMQKGRSGIEQCRIFVLSCRRADVEAARSFFRSIEASLAVSFRQMGECVDPAGCAGAFVLPARILSEYCEVRH